MTDGWTQLGFTVDDVVGAWQHARLAEAFVRAWEQLGRPGHFDVLQTEGANDYLSYWWVSPTAARLLDRSGVAWRRFAIGSAETPPDDAVDVLRLQ
jgi:hypothetical protein